MGIHVFAFIHELELRLSSYFHTPSRTKNHHPKRRFLKCKKVFCGKGLVKMSAN